LRKRALALGATGTLALTVAVSSPAFANPTCDAYGGPAAVALGLCDQQVSAQYNDAAVMQNGDVNVVGAQQVNQSVQQIGGINVARNLARQRLVFRGDKLVKVFYIYKTKAMTDGAVVTDEKTVFVCKPSADDDCLDPEGSALVRTTSDPDDEITGSTQENEQLNEAVVNQDGAVNVAGIQQSNQSIQQIGYHNIARNVAVQTIVYKPAKKDALTTFLGGGAEPAGEPGLSDPAGGDGAATGDAASCAGTCDQANVQVNAIGVDQSAALNLAFVQQANQSIQQIGEINEAENIVRQQIKVKGKPVPVVEEQAPPAVDETVSAG
jgi:hypothetical protein